jgi:hypothetical protein
LLETKNNVHSLVVPSDEFDAIAVDEEMRSVKMPDDDDDDDDREDEEESNEEDTSAPSNDFDFKGVESRNAQKAVKRMNKNLYASGSSRKKGDGNSIMLDFKSLASPSNSQSPTSSSSTSRPKFTSFPSDRLLRIWAAFFYRSFKDSVEAAGGAYALWLTDGNSSTLCIPSFERNYLPHLPFFIAFLVWQGRVDLRDNDPTKANNSKKSVKEIKQTLLELVTGVLSLCDSPGDLRIAFTAAVTKLVDGPNGRRVLAPLVNNSARNSVKHKIRILQFVWAALAGGAVHGTNSIAANLTGAEPPPSIIGEVMEGNMKRPLAEIFSLFSNLMKHQDTNPMSVVEVKVKHGANLDFFIGHTLVTLRHFKIVLFVGVEVVLKRAVEAFLNSIGPELENSDRDFLMKAFQGRGTWSVVDNNKLIEPVCSFQPTTETTPTTSGSGGVGGGTTLFPSHTTMDGVFDRVAAAMATNGGEQRLRIFRQFLQVSHILQGLISLSTIKRDAELHRVLWRSPEIGAPRDFLILPNEVADDNKVPLIFFTKRKLKKQGKGKRAADMLFQQEQSNSGRQTMPAGGNQSFGLILPMLCPGLLSVMLLKGCVVKGLGDPAGWR